MRLRPEQLPGHLRQQLLPVYLVSGDEALLVQEACDAIRSRAREAGCTEREVLEGRRLFAHWSSWGRKSAHGGKQPDRKHEVCRLAQCRDL